MEHTKYRGKPTQNPGHVFIKDRKLQKKLQAIQASRLDMRLVVE